jgi:hypothetical protein
VGTVEQSNIAGDRGSPRLHVDLPSSRVGLQRRRGEDVVGEGIVSRRNRRRRGAWGGGGGGGRWTGAKGDGLLLKTTKTTTTTTTPFAESAIVPRWRRLQSSHATMVPSIDTTILGRRRRPKSTSRPRGRPLGCAIRDNKQHHRHQWHREYEYGRDIRERIASTGGRCGQLAEGAPRAMSRASAFSM